MKLGDIAPRHRLKVKQRLAVVAFAQEHSIRAACRWSGLSRNTVREWRNRWRTEGPQGLIPRHPARRKRRISPETIDLLRAARLDLGYGSGRARIWLHRVHNVRLTQTTIQRVFSDMGRPRLKRPRKRRPRQLRLFEKDNPGESVQVDVKVVRVGSRKHFQYTALDDCTRFRVLRLYPRGVVP